MSKIVVDLEDRGAVEPPLSGYEPSPKKRRWPRVLGIFALILIIVALIGGIGAFLYWQSLKTTPQYSLALLIDASRRDDRELIRELVDTDAVVDDFVPQITDKAIELYGRGIAPELLKRVSRVAAPVIPVVKERARAELPKMLRSRTKQFENVPFFLMVTGAERYLDISVEGNRATVKSKIKNRPLELVMERTGERWKIVAVKDEELAKRIAERVGQQIIALVKDGGRDAIDRVGREIGLRNLGDLLRKAEEIFK